MADRRWALVLVLVSNAACAKRTDAASQRAFDRAQGRGVNPTGPRSEVVSGGGGGVFDRQKFGWDRVAQVVGSAVSSMRASPDDQGFAELAAKWCGGQPEPIATPDGPVRVCIPEPPVIAGGTKFTLELGGDGVIGLVATDLSAPESRKVAKDARAAAKPLCTEPWSENQAVDVAGPTFATCPAQGGPLLSVGRFPRRQGSDRWFVSVAVLSPG